MGDWLNTLFHKNDGYKTPVVINPMRDKGNFDINKEIGFAKYRLLLNALIEKRQNNNPNHKVFLTEKQYISKVIFSLNKKKVHEKKIDTSDGSRISGEKRSTSLLFELLSLYFPDYDYKELIEAQFPFKEAVMNYIVQKADSISETYEGFENGYQEVVDDTSSIIQQNNHFLVALKSDKSHITFKLNQAINFLKHILNVLQKEKKADKNSTPFFNEDIESTFTLYELIDWMEFPESADIVNHLPPSIFSIDFELSTSAGVTSRFNELSSGEQQLIHTINSVTYHLNNLQSIHNGENNRIRYENVNIIYDEIELYFHPEYQQKFIIELLSAISRLSLIGPKKIKAINMLFLTHSPFILSDIAGENVMLLESDVETGMSVQLQSNAETFAANIHEMLAESFFLKGTTMGKFAEKKLNDLINKTKSGQILNIDDEKLMDIIGDSFLRSSFKHFNRNVNG